MIINNNIHIQLIQDELTFQTNEFEKLLATRANKLLNEGKLYTCWYQGLDEVRGNIIVRFDYQTSLPPRKNEQFQCFTPNAHSNGRTDWGGATYRELRTNAITQFEGRTVFFNHEKEFTIVGISGVKEEDITKYKKGALLVLGPPDPPLRYIMNLLSFLKNTPTETNNILDLNIDKVKWNPQPMPIEGNVAALLQTLLAQKDFIIIQGPPGTGKTYLIATLCNALLRANYKVLVTALTNRALTEFAEKDILAEMLEAGMVYKTGLTADESRNKKLKGINAFKSLTRQRPPLLLATYYAMSQLASAAIAWNHFDYVIIEEASQAFLCTIAIARKLGKKCIIIGDIKQLEPIFHKETDPSDRRNYHWMIHGLKTVSYFLQDSIQFILTDTYRLVPNSCAATNSFYNGLLVSKSKEILPFNFNDFPILKANFEENGGTSLKLFDLPDGRNCGSICMKFIIDIIDSVKKYDKEAHVSILAFHRDSVRFFQKEIYSRCSNINDVFVETIDRVQGLTTDFCILLVPMESIPFVLNVNRFNVATSRAKKCTLLISDNSLLKFISLSPEISAYFQHVTKKI